jgi:hypothetical protein
MPVTPGWLTVATAVGVAATVLWPAHAPPRLRLALVITGGMGMLAGSLLAVPHTVLMVVVWTAGQVTGGGGSFDVQPAWLSTGAHLTNIVAGIMIAAWTLAEWRLSGGRCPWCGRTADAPLRTGERSRRTLRLLAAIAVIGALPYGLLKLAWSAGWGIGLTGHGFDDVGFASPGFGDTVVLTGVSVVASVLMGARVTRRVVRIVSAAIGLVGSMMLLPVGVVALVMMVPIALGPGTIDDSQIAAWAFAVVYLSFVTWGFALSFLTAHYWQATRPACRRHRRPDASGHRATRSAPPRDRPSDLPSRR